LELEFQFYVLGPAIVLLCLAVGRRLRSFSAVVIAMVVVVVGMKLAAMTFAPADLQRFLVSQFVELFVLGFVLSFLYARGVFKNPRLVAIATPLFIGGIALAWYVDHLAQVLQALYEPLGRIPLLIAFAATFAGALSGGVGRRFTSSTWIATIGGMCYTIYLIHLMFFQVGTRVLLRFIPVHDLMSATLIYGIILVPLLLVVCGTFFLLIEKPCMNPKWPRKLYRAIRKLFGGRETEAERAADLEPDR
jgi:peptidoglycan/LPS O-acetylase OafA/YrhL